MSGRSEEEKTGNISGIFRLFPQRRGAAPDPPPSLCPGTSCLGRVPVLVCMMRHGFEFYDGVVVIRYVILVSQGCEKRALGAHSFGSVAYS